MYIDVILPLALKDMLSYEVPETLENAVFPGVRVSVELGRRKIYAALVYRVHEGKAVSELKPVLSVLDREPVVRPDQLRLWEWIARYYLCTLGQVMAYFFPSSMRLEHLPEQGETEIYGFEKERKLRKKSVLSLAPSLRTQEQLHGVLDSLKRAKSQQAALTLFLNRMLENPTGTEFEMDREELAASGGTPAGINGLLKKNVLIARERYEETEYEEPKAIPDGQTGLPPLTGPQTAAYAAVEKAFSRNRPALLFGVSGAGKTEIYMHFIHREVAAGNQVLLLIPELALSTQLFRRLETYFKASILAYTSRQTPSARYRIYNRLLHSQQGVLVVGTRSALSLPFTRLKLIIVDEEHDAGYRQSDPAPRFHARDTAVMAGQIYRAGVLLASATPSVDSFFNARQGKYALITLNERFNGLPAPKITVIERRLIAVKEKKELGFTSETRYFSRYLLRRMAETLANGEQVILFQNRRGFSSYVECADCGDIPQCPACNVSLTYHKHTDTLECHYCGTRIPWKRICSRCGSHNMLLQGIGTENIEERIAPYFPEARIVRVDADTLRSRARFDRVMRQIETGEAEIIVGTQIIGKGFDLPQVSLVGVINADNMLGFPDFRASERGYQILSQMAGRLTRGERSGEMIVQSNLYGGVIADLQGLAYERMYEREIADRQRFFFPPFVRIIEFTFKHPDEAVLERGVRIYARRLEQLFGNRVSAPIVPSVTRIRGFYRLQLLLKIEKSRSVEKAKRLVAEMNEKIRNTAEFKSISLSMQVDI